MGLIFGCFCRFLSLSRSVVRLWFGLGGCVVRVYGGGNNYGQHVGVLTYHAHQDSRVSQSDCLEEYKRKSKNIVPECAIIAIHNHPYNRKKGQNVN